MTAWVAPVFAEGSADIGANQILGSGTILFVDILDSVEESFTWSGSGNVTVKDPNGSVAGVFAPGAAITPAMNGTYRVELSQDQTGSWDLTVSASAVALAGRVFAEEWLLSGPSFGPDAATNCSFFSVLPSDGSGNDAVIEVRLEGLAGFDFGISGNRTGVAGPLAGKSVPAAGNTFSSALPMYLNLPSVADYSPLTPNVTNFSVQTVAADQYIFSCETDVAATCHVILDVDMDGAFNLVGSDDLVLTGLTSPGVNEIPWDGLDAYGNRLAEGTYDAVAIVNVGELHFLTRDVETLYSGLRLFSVNSDHSRLPLRMHWDDGLIQSNAVQMVNGEIGLETSGSDGVDPGNYADAAQANINSRAWGDFTGSGKGNDAILDTFGWVTEGQSSVIIVTVPPEAPEIAVEQQPAGTEVIDGGLVSLTTSLDSSTDIEFTIRNIGAEPLTGLTLDITGPHSSDFAVLSAPIAPVEGPIGSTSLVVRFTPSASGMRSAAISIDSNDADENPFDILVEALVLSISEDSDSDGLNDVAEWQMAPLGFDWQVSQVDLVNTYYGTANLADLYTPEQVQALNVGTPLIQRDPATGTFNLTIGVQKSADLQEFFPFPMSDSNTSINGEGKLEFEFTVPDDAAFFRLESN